MPTQSIRKNFGMTLAAALIGDIQYLRANYYYYLGKTEPWDDASTTRAPEVAGLGQSKDNDIRSRVIIMQHIAPGDLSLITKRYDWVSGQVYARWDDTKDMSLEKFYAMNSDTPPKVYKCIDNAGGDPSINEPTTTSYDVITTADGYVWKYMYTIPPFKITRFASQNNMPVQRAVSDSFYNNGALSDIVVNSGGSGYVPQGEVSAGATLIRVTDTNKTAGSGATAKVATVNSVGEVLTVTVTAGGTGYITSSGARSLIVNTGARGGSVLTPVISADGVITSITVDSGGLGYAVEDVVTITVGGAKLAPVLDANGSIVHVRILDGGVGYSAPPDLTVSGAGTSAYATGHAIVTAVLSNTRPTPPLSLPQGQVINVRIDDLGINYRAGVTLTNITGDGFGATCSPIISAEGVITGMVLNNRGYGYTYALVNFTRSDETGSGATFTVNITQQDYASDQANVEQSAVPGAIYTTQIVAGGTDYTQANTTVTIIGDGTGAVATATITNGEVSKITMVQRGHGYSFAKFIVKDSSTNSVNASIRAIFPPPNGHGFDATAELYANSVCISTLLSATDVITTLDQDYRQYGIIRNPNNYNSTAFASINDDLLCYQMFLVGAVAFTKDALVTYGVNNEYGYIVANSAPYVLNGVAGTTVWLIPIFDKYVIPIGAVKQGADDMTISHTIKVPTINKYSGQLLLSSNETQFTFTNKQRVAIKSYIKL